jgi:hypothetical protein
MNISLGKLLKASLFSVFAVFGVSFSHALTVNAASMSSGAMNQSMDSAQCQSVCMATLPINDKDKLIAIRNDDLEPKPFPYYGAAISLLALALAFIVKRLLQLTSWRPPDLVLLHGHYADGL